MRVLMLPHPQEGLGNESGIKRVVEAYFRHLPRFDVELVSPNATSYDLKAVHAGMTGGDCTVAHCHGLYWTADYNANYWQYRVNGRIIDAIRHAKEVTVPSDWVADVFRRDMRFTPHIVPHGIDWQLWQHKEKNQGYVLWNKNRAGIDVCDNSILAPLIQKFSKITFVSTFAPNGMNPASEEWPANLKVTENGVIPHREMKRVVQRAGVYLSTTKETFGIGVLEAMAAGVPVLGYDYGGNSILVQHGVTGYLARPGDFDDLCEGLNYCLKYRNVLGANGREAAKGWTWDKVCEQVAGIYRLAMEEEEPTVSVVIPVYRKTKEQVRRAIESATDQNIQPNQVILVVDGEYHQWRDDAELMIYIDELKNDNRVTIIKQPNQGVAIARNNGIAQTTSKYVCCLDSDDWIEPTFLETCIRELELDNSLGIAYTGLKWHDSDGTSGISEWPGEFDANRQLTYHHKMNQVPTCCVFRREAWERVGGYRQRYAPMGAGSEDAAFWSAICAAGYGARKVTNEPLFNYSASQGNVHGNREYSEVDWLSMYPWASDGQHPFASVAPPHQESHPVRQYDEPVVSVIIPVGPGHENEVFNALDSLEMQHFRKWEAVVVWDVLSKDCDNKTYLKPLGREIDYTPPGHNPVPRYVEPIKKSYPYARMIYTSQKGSGYARNRGAEIARANLLLFLDADDALNDPHALEKMLDAWNDQQAIIYGDYLGKATWDEEEARKEYGDRFMGYLPKKGQAILRYYAADYNWQLAQDQPRFDKTRPGMPYYLWCLVSVLIPKAWHNAIGGFDEEMPTWEDVDYFWRLAKAGYCFHRIEEPLVLYNFDSGNRRESAIPRDADSRQKHKNLIQYIKHKYEKLENIMCNCGNGKATPAMVSQVTVAENGDATLYAPRLGRNVSDSEMVMVTFRPTYSGDRPVVGPATGIKYGYGRIGETFPVHQLDIDANPTWYKPVKAAVEVPQEERVTPEPKLTLDMGIKSIASGMIFKDYDVSYDEGKTQPVSATIAPEENLLKTRGTQDATPKQEVLAVETSRPEPPPVQLINLEGLPGVNTEIVGQFITRGWLTKETLLEADLTEITGIGKKRAKEIREYLEGLA